MEELLKAKFCEFPYPAIPLLMCLVAFILAAAAIALMLIKIFGS